MRVLLKSTRIGAGLRSAMPRYVTARQHRLLTALGAGTPVYLAEYGIAPIRRQETGNIARCRVAHAA